MILTIDPHPLRGAITAPPSKSYAHRYLIASFLSGQQVTVSHVGHSQDIAATLSVLQSLGGAARRQGEALVLSRGALPTQAVSLDCNESGSTLRFMMPIVAALGVEATFVGRRGLMARPIEGLVQTLSGHGATIDGYHVAGRLRGGCYTLDATVSSQYCTGLLFALPLLSEDSRLVLVGEVASQRYIDVTLDVLHTFGIRIEHRSDGYFIPGGQTYTAPISLTVEGDWSGAAFWLAAGALGEGITVRGLDPHSTQGDSAILSCLARFGANVQVRSNTICVTGCPLRGTQIDVDAIPDLAQILAVVGAYAQGETVLKHVNRLRLKESDRLDAIVRMLTLSGISCTLTDSDLHIIGGHPHGAAFVGGNDHRTVMSSAILATFAQGPSTIDDVEATGKSYPDFVRDLITLGGHVHV